MTARAHRSSPRRRSVLALAVVLMVLLAFTVRLVDIQIVNAEEHRAQSRDGLGHTRELHGARGTIVDQNGAVLAGNVMLYDLELDPKNVFTREEDDSGRDGAARWPEEAARIAQITGQSTEEIQALVADAVAADPDSRWVRLAQRLSTEQFVALRELGLGYLTMPAQPSRAYPDGAVAGNLIGFVGSDGEPLAGFEIAQNECLAPENGYESFESGRDGVVIPGTREEVAPTDGGTLTLTINRDLQWYMQQLVAEQVQNYGANYGTVFVVEVETGKVRAAAEYPTVDPNDVAAVDPADRGSRIFSNPVEPGSTFKPLTAAAVIDAGAATALTPTVPAAAPEEMYNGITISDVFLHPSYDYTFAGALVDSSNVALSKFGDLVSEDVRYDYLKRFGIGETTAIGFPGEEAGLVPAPPWDAASHWTTTFGQYYTTTVPQLAGVYQTIANGGVRSPLRLVESCTGADGTVTEPQMPEPVRVISEKTADEVTLMLENVYMQVENHDEIEVAGYRVATKTGTAEKPDPVNGGYKSNAFYTSMAGFAPADDPKYVVVLTLDEPRNMMSAANAPGFQKAMTQVLKTYRVVPTGAPGPEILPKYQ